MQSITCPPLAVPSLSLSLPVICVVFIVFFGLLSLSSAHQSSTPTCPTAHHLSCPLPSIQASPPATPPPPSLPSYPGDHASPSDRSSHRGPPRPRARAAAGWLRRTPAPAPARQRGEQQRFLPCPARDATGRALLDPPPYLPKAYHVTSQSPPYTAAAVVDAPAAARQSVWSCASALLSDLLRRAHLANWRARGGWTPRCAPAARTAT